MKTISSSSAEQNLQNAVTNLSTTASSQVDIVMQSLGRAAAEGIEGVTDSIVKGLKDIKSELNISHIAEASPLSFVAGSFVAGAIFEYATSRIKPVASGQNNQEAENGEGILPYLPLLIAASQWGFTKLRERNRVRA